LALAGHVAGRRILDVGCGSGPLSEALRDRGAIVTGLDASAKMVELARRRLGDGADLQVADLGGPLPFPGSAFDDVIACLVLHYLEDWTGPLAELRRVLKPGGRLIVAVDHPFVTTLADLEAGPDGAPVAQRFGQGTRAAADVQDPAPGHVPGQGQDRGPGIISADQARVVHGRIRLSETVVVVDAARARGHSALSDPPGHDDRPIPGNMRHADYAAIPRRERSPQQIRPASRPASCAA